ncbi:ABC transporter permease [Lapidilactobacillus mulanensis]|nr:ABC transporter permease [Lapidilactobacillus mulanensis]
MSIMTKLSIRSLRTELARTIMTILAMAIAATMAVAVLVGLRSMQISMYNYYVKDSAGQQVSFSGVSRQRVKAFRDEEAFANTAAYTTKNNVAIKEIKAGEYGADKDNPLTQITITPADLKLAGKQLLVGGRLPRKSNEVMLSEMLIGGDVKIGRTITVKTGQDTHKYRVVGVMSQFKGFLTEGQIIHTASTLPAGRQVVMAKVKSTRDIHQKMPMLAKRYGVKARSIIYQEQALNIIGESADSKTKWALVAVVVAVLAIIGVAALIMIYTSINLTVKAHRQRYGLLRSIGTTPKQLHHLVYQQSLLLAVPALILGYGFGIGGITLAMTSLKRMFANHELPLDLVLVVDWLPLLIAAVFMILITLLAAARPAYKASRVTPIVAIRALDPSPKLTKRHLKSTWLIRRVKQPIMKLALKNYRRSSRKWSMLVTLTTTVTIFVGLTGFVRNVLQDQTPSYTADITGTLQSQEIDMQDIKRILTEQGGIKESQVVREMSLMMMGKAKKWSHRQLWLYVIPNDVAKKEFNSVPTVINGKIYNTTADGKATEKSLVEPDDPRTLSFTTENLDDQGKQTKTKIITTHFNLATHESLPQYQLILYPGDSALVISQSTFEKWAPTLNVDDSQLTYSLGLTLKDRETHTAFVKALKLELGDIYIYDQVANAREAEATLTAMRTGVYGFITLLSLISLATIINHTFAALLEQRRGLAILQSVGTTAKQITGMLSIQNALLLTRGWVFGSVLGSGIARGLYQLMSAGQISDKSFHWPIIEIVVTAVALLLIGAVFAIVTWRMIRKQDIDLMIRTE